MVKALALGADTVMIGRPTLYVTAVVGAAGAMRALAIFQEEIGRMMAHLGCGSVAAIDRNCASTQVGNYGGIGDDIHHHRPALKAVLR